MQEVKKRGSGSHLLAGILLAEFGFLLFPLGGWDGLKTDTRMLIYCGGSLLFFTGLFLICIAVRLASVTSEPELILGGKPLGNFQLNGYSFQACECNGTDGGKQFRLISSPSISPAQEAAFIRYIIHERLIEDLLPRMDKRIEEEAKWAFLPQT